MRIRSSLGCAVTLGVTVAADVDGDDPLIAPTATHVVIDDARNSPLAPLERIELPHVLSGAQGTNRMVGLCYLQSRHDLEAVRSYLHRYSDRPQALRACTRELERLVLRAETERGKPMSSLDVDDCEAFLRKTFPYVSERGVTAGVAITFADVSDRMRAEASRHLTDA